MDDLPLHGFAVSTVKEGEKVEWALEVSRHMPVRPTIDSSSLRTLSKALADIDPDLRKRVGKDIKDAVRPTARRILGRVPTAPPLRGMANSGRLGWSKPRVGAYATPGGGRGSIARIELFASKSDQRAGFKMADLAGTRNAGTGIRRAHSRTLRSGRVVQVRRHATRSGDIMIQRLNQRYPLASGGKAGRFGWQNFMKERPFLIRQVLDIIDGFVATVNRKGLR